MRKIVLVLVTYGAALAATKKGDELLRQATEAQRREDYAAAVRLSHEAWMTDPEDVAYRLRYWMVDAAMKLRVPAVTSAAPPETLVSTRLLKPASDRLRELRLANQSARTAYTTVGKLMGINVLFDPELPPDAALRNVSLDLSNTTLEDALDHLSLMTKTFWRVLSENTIFVVPDNAGKRRDHEEFVFRIFYLRNVTTAQELNEIATVIRSVVDIRRLIPYTTQMALAARGTVDQVKLIADMLPALDQPRSEVEVEVLVMEVNRTKSRSLAATLSNGTQAGLQSLIQFTGGEDKQVALSRVGSLSTRDFAVAVPDFYIQALVSQSDTRVLQSPRVRAIDATKTTLRIGDRYPYATGSFQTGAVGTGGSPLVSTQFQFADVGVNVDITPKIHGDEVSMHIEMDVSNIRDQVDVGGLRQPVIGQRKVQQDIRLKVGEVSLVAGLTQLGRSRTARGLPGLAAIPFLGSQGREENNSELMIALIPRLVRGVPAAPTGTVSTGTDTNVRVKEAPAH